MVHHTPPQARTRSVPIFIHPYWSILGVLCDQYGYVPLALVACTLANQPHPWNHWGIDKGAKTCTDDWCPWYITHHPRQRMKVPQFSFIHPWYILWIVCGKYGCDPLLGCLYNNRQTSTMYPLVNWEGCQHLYGLLEVMVHYTPSKAEAKSVQISSIYPGYILELLCCQYGCDPLLSCLYNCVSTSPMNTLMDWVGCKHLNGLLERLVITHHQRQRLKVCQFSFIHAVTSLEYCVASMDVIPLLGYLCNCVSTSPMYQQMNWEWCQNLYRRLEFRIHHTPS